MKKKFGAYNLLVGIVVGVIFGAVLGSVFPEAGVSIGFLGKLFLNSLMMIVLPLIIVSITLSIMRLGDIKNFGSLGLKTFAYYTVTTGVAVVIGIILVVLIEPGAGGNEFLGALPEKVSSKQDFSFTDLVLSLINSNLINAALKFEILPLVFASILFGVAFASLGKEGSVIESVFSAIDKAIMKIVGWIMFLSPLGIMALIADRLGSAGGGMAVVDLVLSLGKYAATVVGGLIIHGVIILPLLLALFSKRNPLTYVSTMAKALVTAFSTASSSATLPITMQCVEDGAGVDKKISRFVLPFGATVNMDGTALYEAVAAIFIAQSYGIELGGIELVTIFITATIAAVGAAGIPEAGLITLILVLHAVGLPAEGIGLILAIDWLLDRFRTTVNVWGDSIGAAILNKWEKGGP